MAKKLFGAAAKAHAKKVRKEKARKARRKAAAASKPKTKRSPVAKKKTTRRRRKSGNPALKQAAAAIAGGAAGAVAGHLLRGGKVKPNTIAVGLVATGLVGTTSLTGNARWFSAGLATSGASQYARGWAEVNLKRKGLDADALPPGTVPVHALPAGRNADVDVVAAFQEAQAELDQEAA